MTDPIADLLTRIRNALQARHATLVVPRSKIKLEIVKVLKQEGFLEGFTEVEGDVQGSIKVSLRYDAAKKSVLRGLERVSRPGRRAYVGRDELPRVRNGLGVVILTTSKGVLTDAQARRAGVGGEILCRVW
jgi:small subunit ribosomal protein S8